MDLIEVLLVLQIGEVFLGTIVVVGEYVGKFYAFLGIQHALYAKVMGVIFVINYAQLKGFKKLWLECDFSLPCQAYGSTHTIP